MQVLEVTEYNTDVVKPLQRLLPRMSKSAAPPSEEFTGKIVELYSSRLIVAREDDVILGMLTIAIIPIPSGVRAWIKGVVVDEAGRGKGVGEALNKHALKLVRREGTRTVDLTSRPSREAVNRLYQRIGFIPRETNSYCFDVAS